MEGPLDVPIKLHRLRLGQDLCHSPTVKVLHISRTLPQEALGPMYLSRAVTMIWLGTLTTYYLKISTYDSSVSSKKSPLDFIKAIASSVTRS